ncbi:Ig-like domain-containing protein [Archangium sp.]|jgi:hypothetical protein|uniref:Ig-like domain-containing protein n=1 Tax=Archangium sp. TaxID=1872627 RepID=UPI002ED87447
MFVSRQLGLLGLILGAALAVSCGGGDEPEIGFILPSAGTVTRGELGIALSVRGIAPERMSLFVDEAWVANLTEASYRWDTRNWPEGEHTLVARAFVGEEVFSSKGLQVVLDRTPPQLVSVTPAREAKDVAVDAPVSLVFSEPLAASALATASLLLSVDGREVERLAPSSLSPDGKTLFFPSPFRRYPPPVTLTALLVGGVEDAAGNVLVPARDSGWSWQVPVVLSLGDAMADLAASSRGFIEHGVALRLDGEGRPMVAWSRVPGSVVLRRWNGTKWDSLPSGSGSLNFAEGAVLAANSLALDVQGRATTAWNVLPNQSRSFTTYLHRLEAGQWKSLGSVGTGSAEDFPSIHQAVMGLSPSGLPRVARMAGEVTTGQGQVTVLQARGESGDGDYSVRSSNALMWAGVALEVSASGDPVVAWIELTDSGKRIVVDRWVSTGWESLPMTPPSSVAYHPSLALEPDGTPLVAWSGNEAIEVRRWANGAWQAVGQPIPASTGGRASRVVSALALGASGQPVLAWSVPGRLEVWGLREGTWVRLEQFLHPISNETTPWPVFLRDEGTGSPVMAWIRRDASNPDGGSLGVYRLNL